MGLDRLPASSERCEALFRREPSELMRPARRLEGGPLEGILLSLDDDLEIRTVLSSANAMTHSTPATAALSARGHFPTEQAALSCRCLLTRSLDHPDNAGHGDDEMGASAEGVRDHPSPTAGPQQRPAACGPPTPLKPCPSRDGEPPWHRSGLRLAQDLRS